MKIESTKEIILEIVTLASRFTSNKIATAPTLQGVYLTSKKKTGEENMLHIYASDLSSFFHTKIKTSIEGEVDIVIEPKKIIEFVGLLEPGPIILELKEKTLTVAQGKKKGAFSLMPAADFPVPPIIEEKEQMVKVAFLAKYLPLVLFSASTDEARPVLTGINFVTGEADMMMVSTDGFRLTIVKTKKEIDVPSIIIPGGFLSEILQAVKGEKEIGFSYSSKEKLVRVRSGPHEFFSRLIDGEFPPYERVLPVEKKSEAIVDTNEIVRNIKLISVFAREYSNIVLLELKKDELVCRPKVEGASENVAQTEIELKGDEQTIAFNYRFLLDFLNHSESKRTIIEVLRPDAPVVFKMEGNTDFLHIIMPVRIQ